jgi:hypothetical protein
LLSASLRVNSPLGTFSILIPHLLFQKPKVDKSSQIFNQIVIKEFVVFVI